MPSPLTRFVGREDEIEIVVELVRRADVRLLTLTGPGGIGKTRLSIEAASRLVNCQDGAVYFVALAPVLCAGDAMAAIAEALGVWDVQKGALIQRITETLDGGETLLVLDNLEHVIDVAVDLGDLLLACPGLTMLVTSRVPLHIQGEREYSVPQLILADPDATVDPVELLAHESIALFVDRAQAVNQQFMLDNANAKIVAQICTRLEGLPLAIELAAARIKVLPPAALLRRLDNQLGILRSESRDLPDRLQTMRATIDWSYELLTPDEQRAICCLSIFSGNFSIEAAGAVLGRSADDAIDVIASLIDNSLMISRGHFNEQPYYRILTVVREFGLERLGESGDADQARLRHAEYFARVAERSYSGQFSVNQGQVFRSLDRDHDNIRQALNWAIAAEQWELAAGIAAYLWQYWVVRGNFAEGRQWFARLLDQDVDYPLTLLPDLYFGFVYLAGTLEELQQNPEMARRLLHIGERTGDRKILATGTILVGLRPWDTDGMADCLTAIELWQELDEPIWAGRAAGEVSRIARELGDIDTAEAYAYQAYELVRETGHLWGLAQMTARLGRIHHVRGETDEALAMLKEALSLLSHTSDWILVLRAVEFLIDIAGSQRQYRCVTRLTAAITRIRTKIGYGIRYSFDQAVLEKCLEQARSALGQDIFDSEWEAGLRLTVDQVIAEAVSIETEARVEAASDESLRLSRREREVLKQIVTGQTDQEIADELFISYRTVTTHVSHILNKLGANSRTEAAAIAVRDRLT